MITSKKKFQNTTLLLYCSIALLLFPLLRAQAQNAPPTLLSMVPHGGQSGATVTVLIDGTNLGGASRILFNGAGLSASIVKNRELPNKRPKPKEGEVIRRAIIDDGAAKNRLSVSISIDPNVKPDIYGFRVLTPLGLTNMLPFAVGPFPEVDEKQMNDSLDQAQRIRLPATVKGEISQVGDTDHFSFEAKVGQELVFETIAAELDSKLNSILTLLDGNGKVLAENDDFSGPDSVLIYQVKEDGTYSIRISDAQMGSGTGFHYRLNAGEFAYLTEVFPLGVQAGQMTVLKVRGANLGDTESVMITAERGEWEKTIPVSVPPALNTVQIAVGTYPEEFEQEPNSSVSSAQSVSLPVTINGHISSTSSNSVQNAPDRDFFRFSAQKGQRLILEVGAERLGSLLDSVIEVVDPEGRPVPRATLRCVAETEVTLSDPDSIRTGMRVLSWDDFAIDDYVIVGREIVQVEALPRGPDDDMRFRSFLGRRIAFFDTTAEAHAIGDPVYKVRIFPPGREFAPNGMPVFHLNYRNDDGGPVYGSDSRVEFVVPENGSYLVEIRDVRGFEGERYAYRLTIREAAPDFKLTSGTIRIAGQFGRNRSDRQTFNVPPGGQIPVNVLAYRIDGFDGDIEVAIEDLPKGLAATKGVIAAGDDSTVLLLQTSKEALFEPVPLKIVGQAKIGNEIAVRRLDTENKLSLIAMSAPPEIEVLIDRPRVEIVPGREVQVTVQINRQNGFGARVPVEIRNLPHGVRVLDVGLNGILITEAEKSRTFTLYAEPWAKAVKRPFYAVGRVETNSFIPLEHVSDPVELVLLP
ncbi:PPC domain-containing protein [Acidobacteria bacterium AH-259-O06]|nr:PPC domain-containing protein [Acidobacteria bacterium AH-259-O06]